MEDRYFTMSLDQLLTKQTELAKKYTQAIHAGMNGNILNTLLEHMESVRLAIWEYHQKEDFKREFQDKKDDFDDTIV